MKCELWVYSFKEGLLSAVAHDLKIKVNDINIDLESKRASVDAASLEVHCAMNNGVENHAALSASQKDEINEIIQSKVLNSATFPQIEFVLKEQSAQGIKGMLSLHGCTREISGHHVKQNGVAVMTFEIDQTDFNIVPFKAMLGALKIKPLVRVLAHIHA
jgi:polyisoprenoid-binding protein YceI